MVGSGAARLAVLAGTLINSSFYAEFTAYGNLSPRMLTDLAGGFDNTVNRFSGMAPYWRFAYEKTWDKNSLMFGTYGMYAEQQTVSADDSGWRCPAVFFWENRSNSR